MTRSSSWLSSLLVVMSALQAAPLHAEPNGRGRAAAEAIFQQATALMDQKKYAEACEKFSASQDLDPGLGTLLYLADCYDQAGRTASSWALFREVAERSKRAGQQDREHIASERAGALEGKLSKLELRVSPARQANGLEIRVGGSAVHKGSWNLTLPVDPGATTIEARAPGKLAWSIKVDIARGPSQRVVELPELRDAPRPRPAPEAALAADRAAPPSSSTQKTLGFLMGGVGVVALAAGGVFAYRARSQDQLSKEQCRTEDPNLCSQQGFDERKRAKTSANVASITSVSGAALMVGALVVVLSAPSEEPRRRQAAPGLERSVAGLGTWHVGLRGQW